MCSSPPLLHEKAALSRIQKFEGKHFLGRGKGRNCPSSCSSCKSWDRYVRRHFLAWATKNSMETHLKWRKRRDALPARSPHDRSRSQQARSTAFLRRADGVPYRTRPPKVGGDHGSGRSKHSKRGRFARILAVRWASLGWIRLHDSWFRCAVCKMSTGDLQAKYQKLAQEYGKVRLCLICRVSGRSVSYHQAVALFSSRRKSQFSRRRWSKSRKRTNH